MSRAAMSKPPVRKNPPWWVADQIAMPTKKPMTKAVVTVVVFDFIFFASDTNSSRVITE